MRLLKKWWPAILTVALFVLVFFLSQLIPEETARRFIVAAGPWGPLVVLLLFLSTYVIAPLNGSPILFAGYYAYGINVIFLATLAGIISFVINFWIARNWGRDFIEKLVGARNIKKIDRLTENYGLVSLFFLRFLQGGLHDFVSYAAGITSMRFAPYMIVSLLAEIPGTALWYYIVSRVGSPAAFTVVTWIMAISLSVLFFLSVLLIQKTKKK
jgi:uncharacterized membrane protein YdjX (TVP38/TMEM64 family)